MNVVVFLSADRHLTEISRLPAGHAEGVGYPLFDEVAVLSLLDLGIPEIVRNGLLKGHGCR